MPWFSLPPGYIIGSYLFLCFLQSKWSVTSQAEKSESNLFFKNNLTALSISSNSLIGEVACKPTTLSKYSFLDISFIACNQADSELAKSLDNFLGLIIVFAPRFDENSRISLSSEVTHVELIFFDFRLLIIDQYNSGLLHILIKFFFFIPFEPPRAGIIVINFGFYKPLIENPPSIVISEPVMKLLDLEHNKIMDPIISFFSPHLLIMFLSIL